MHRDAHVTCEHGCTNHQPLPTDGAGQLGVGQYLGATDIARAFTDFQVNTVRHSCGRALPNHTHDWPFISTLLRGSYVSRTRTAVQEFRRMTPVFHPRDLEHEDEIGREGGFFLCIQIAPHVIEGLPASTQQAARNLRHMSDPVSYLKVGQLFQAICEREDDLVCEALLYDLVSEGDGNARPGSPLPPWLASVVEQIEDEWASELSLAQMASRVGVHQTTLSRLFRQHTGRSIGVYRNQVRARRALSEVTGSSFPLNFIAAEAGYADQSHLTRDFKRTFGMTPARMRACVL